MSLPAPLRGIMMWKLFALEDANVEPLPTYEELIAMSVPEYNAKFPDKPLTSRGRALPQPVRPASGIRLVCVNGTRV